MSMPCSTCLIFPMCKNRLIEYCKNNRVYKVDSNEFNFQLTVTRSFVAHTTKKCGENIAGIVLKEAGIFQPDKTSQKQREIFDILKETFRITKEMIE